MPSSSPCSSPTRSQAYGLFGAGSVLADMVAAYRQNDVAGTLWCIPFKTRSPTLRRT